MAEREGERQEYGERGTERERERGIERERVEEYKERGG